MAAFEMQLRLPDQVKKGEVIEVKLKIRHLSRTGLAAKEDAATKFERFTRAEPAVFVRQVEVFYGDRPAGTFEMNSSVSDDPIVGFKLRADREAPVRAVAVNYKRETAEVSADIRFTA